MPPIEQPKKSQRELVLEAELAAARARIRDLEVDVHVRDEQVRQLSKPKPVKMDPQATDRFRRPFRGR